MGGNQAREALFHVAMIERRFGSARTWTPRPGDHAAFEHRLRAGVDASPTPLRTGSSRAPDCDAAQRLTEIIDIVPGLPDGVDDGGERNEDLVQGDFNIDRINDPAYQALVATGLFRPR